MVLLAGAWLFPLLAEVVEPEVVVVVVSAVAAGAAVAVEVVVSVAAEAVAAGVAVAAVVADAEAVAAAVVADAAVDVAVDVAAAVDEQPVISSNVLSAAATFHLLLSIDVFPPLCSYKIPEKTECRMF